MPNQSHRRKSSARYVTVGAAPGKGTRAEWLCNACAIPSPEFPPNMAIIYISQPVAYPAWSVANSYPWEGLPSSEQPTRIVCIWDCYPIDASVLVSWKDSLLCHLESDHYILVCPPDATDVTAFQQWVVTALTRWRAATDADEPKALTIGDHIVLPNKAEPKFLSSAYVSLSFGIMQDRLEQLEYWRRRYLQQLHLLTDQVRSEIHKRLTPALRRCAGTEHRDWAEQERLEEKLREYIAATGLGSIFPSALPAILLGGETGSGKTMLARHLARCGAGTSIPLARVSMPEYEGSEHLFEHDLFGFCGGAYSDAPDEGSPGILLNHIGGIVFLDEIGDSSPAVQRKLLAYLDDYQVRPRSMHHAIFCPTLIVAATNHDLVRHVEDGQFRKDLYERFDVRISVPSLNERKKEMDLILDQMLQNPAINPDGTVTSIGEGAHRLLLDHDYTDGNFRRLERLLQESMREARLAGRAILLADDIMPRLKAATVG